MRLLATLLVALATLLPAKAADIEQYKKAVSLPGGYFFYAPRTELFLQLGKGCQLDSRGLVYRLNCARRARLLDKRAYVLSVLAYRYYRYGQSCKTATTGELLFAQWPRKQKRHCNVHIRALYMHMTRDRRVVDGLIKNFLNRYPTAPTFLLSGHIRKV